MSAVQLQFGAPAPRARRTDDIAAHEAASAVAPGNEDLVLAIRRWVFSRGPSTQEEIAVGLVPDEEHSRWRRSSVISACARAGLVKVATDTNRRGMRVGVYGVVTETAETQGRI